MKSAIKKLLNKLAYRLPYIRKLFLERDQLKVELEKLKMWMPLVHFHSPIPSIDEVKLKEKEIFNSIPREIPGIDLNEQEQINLFTKFKQYYKEQPFEAHKKENLRYFFENPSYSYSDAIFLYCMVATCTTQKDY